MHLVAFGPLGVGLVIAFVGALGWRERLPRNRFAGVRTPATLRDDETFRVGNKVAGLPIMVAGLVGVVTGVFALAAGQVVAVVGLVGMGAIVIAGGLLGHRAAAAMPRRAPELPEGCKGCACGGCDLAKAARSVGTDVSGMGRE